MSYQGFYTLADDYIRHSDAYISALTDDFIKSRYSGFLAVSAVTVYELCISDICINFARRKHKVFGTFVAAKFERLNGRIRLGDVRNHLDSFGDKYRKRFDRKLGVIERKSLSDGKGSVEQAYTNILVWRHTFAHEGRPPTNATYDEVKSSYELGKKVIDCMFQSLRL